mmetsp:Transcript_26145/g.84377  ORF Transcript_26145/g.84377 Transcript_26145/m.84377 type:complete len:233 (+) Transcript_26145:1980-2678(+)
MERRRHARRRPCPKTRRSYRWCRQARLLPEASLECEPSRPARTTPRRRQDRLPPAGASTRGLRPRQPRRALVRSVPRRNPTGDLRRRGRRVAAPRAGLSSLALRCFRPMPARPPVTRRRQRGGPAATCCPHPCWARARATRTPRGPSRRAQAPNSTPSPYCAATCSAARTAIGTLSRAAPYSKRRTRPTPAGLAPSSRVGRSPTGPTYRARRAPPLPRAGRRSRRCACSPRL